VTDSAPESFAGRGFGLLRLVHPFPSALDGIVTGAIVLLAGGPPVTALRLGLAMVLLQFSIGALNDIVDLAGDRLAKPAKPLAARSLGVSAARLTLALCLAAGLVLSAMSGLGVLAVAVAGILAGFAYDLRLKGTALSWLPWAAGIPLLPLYAWLGAGRGLTGFFPALLVMAAFAGTALALANGIADFERDRMAGVRSIVVVLGPATAWRIEAALQLVVAVLATGTAVRAGGLTWGPTSLLFGGLGLLGVGLVLGRAGSPGRRERAWELQAIGTGCAAAGWLAIMIASGTL
jgi:4-hydroxybenzoate polyprenyltransferase